MPTTLLKQQGHDITVFYANSNIAPEAEYHHRLDELLKYAAQQEFRVIEGTYDPKAWEREVAPIGEALKQFSPAFGAEFARESIAASPVLDAELAQPYPQAETTASCSGVETPSGPATVAELLDDERRKERCRACYRMRLEEAARYAAAKGFEGLATTLAVSPYQFTSVIREELERACTGAGIAWHFQDYRPYYDEATRISRELGMYRQNYCGCRFSVREGEATRAFVKQLRKAQKAQRQAQRKAEDDARKQIAKQKQAYAQAQAKKKAILKALRADSRAQ